MNNKEKAEQIFDLVFGALDEKGQLAEMTEYDLTDTNFPDIKAKIEGFLNKVEWFK